MECKSGSVHREYISTSTGRRPKRDDELSRSDSNKLLFFSENPVKYASGTRKSKEKITYLESIKHKFTDGQLATYNAARKKYDDALVDDKATRKKNFNNDLNEAFSSHKSVKIRYKGSWRTIDLYAINNTYCVAYCHLAQDIRTFRKDRIQDIKLSDSFDFDKSLERAAQEKLTEAPSYRGYRYY